MNNRRIRVLVVDDSVVIRRLLTEALATDPEIEVAGVAANGKIALAKIPQICPDIVTLDIEMPEMNGLETLVELRKLYPKLPVIMFSTLTQKGAEATLDALARGASDYVTKPANVGSVAQAQENVRIDLIPKLKALCGRTPSIPGRKLTTPGSPTIGSSIGNPLQKHKKPNTTARIDAIAIGVSTGGPNALQTILPSLPNSLPVPVFVVQHMPPIFTNHLANRLNQLCALTVCEAKEGDVVEPGGIWIAPGNYHMSLRRDGEKIRVALDQGTPENSCRPAVDVLFRSASDLYGPNLLGVVLTGMGQDGMRGCEYILAAGGQTMAQDADTSVVWGMPGAVVNAGLAQKILPLGAIANALTSSCSLGRPKFPIQAGIPTTLRTFSPS